MEIIDNYEVFLEHAELMCAIAYDDLISWETKYYTIFAPPHNALLDNVGFQAATYDPDIDEATQVIAHVEALRSKAFQLQRIVDIAGNLRYRKTCHKG